MSHLEAVCEVVMDRNDRPIIVNDDAPIRDPRVLKLILHSIFGSLSASPLVAQLEEELLACKEHLYSHQAISQVLRKTLTAALDSNPHNGDMKRLLIAVLQHESETAENGRAYVPVGRFNPNAVLWPDPTDATNGRSIYDERPFAKLFKFLDKSTPIGSAGSCFAMEIAHKLQEDGYNYVVTEPNPHSTRGYSIAPARWGILFNTSSFRQLVEKAFGHRQLPKLLWSLEKNGKSEFRDPFREDVTFDSVEEYEADYARHLQATREALLKSKVFVLTLGMNEVWYLKTDGSVFSRCPWRLSSSLVERRVLTVDENVDELQQMLDLWRRYNPELKVILSVSPVPLHATFRGDDFHVITANCHSKSTLRLAAEKFALNNRDVYYFPSYETVMYCTESPWDRDQRHVARSTVAKVMNLFETMFVADRQSQETPEVSGVSILNTGKAVNLLIHPNWQGDLAPTSQVLDSYLSAYSPEEDVCLVLWLPIDASCTAQDAEARIASLITALGHDLERTPDILIYQEAPHSRLTDLLKEVGAVLSAGGKEEFETCEMARALGKTVTEVATPTVLKTIVDNLTPVSV